MIVGCTGYPELVHERKASFRNFSITTDMSTSDITAVTDLYKQTELIQTNKQTNSRNADLNFPTAGFGRLPYRTKLSRIKVTFYK